MFLHKIIAVGDQIKEIMDFYAENMDFSRIKPRFGGFPLKKIFYIRGLKYCTRAIILMKQAARKRLGEVTPPLSVRTVRTGMKFFCPFMVLV